MDPSTGVGNVDKSMDRQTQSPNINSDRQSIENDSVKGFSDVELDLQDGHDSLDCHDGDDYEEGEYSEPQGNHKKTKT